MTPHPPTSTLFSYTTLFRSHHHEGRCFGCEGDRAQRQIREHGRADAEGSRLQHLGGSRRRYDDGEDRKSTRLNSSHVSISYAVFCLKKKKNQQSVIYISNTT